MQIVAWIALVMTNWCGMEIAVFVFHYKQQKIEEILFDLLDLLDSAHQLRGNFSIQRWLCKEFGFKIRYQCVFYGCTCVSAPNMRR